MKKILVVDDDKTIRDLIKDYLEQEGYYVVVADSGWEAYKAKKREKFDLILLDILMPGMDGRTAYMAMKFEDGKFVDAPPVLIITGYADHRYTRQLLEREPGVKGILKKPFTLEELKQKIEETLNE